MSTSNFQWQTNKKSRVKNIVSYFFGAMGATFKVGKQDYVLEAQGTVLQFGRKNFCWKVPEPLYKLNQIKSH